MRLPVAVEPVNEIARTSGCAHSGSPASLPRPWTTLSTPGGTPASKGQLAERARGHRRARFILAPRCCRTRGGGATFQVAVANGTFRGEISAHTPTGWNSV